MGLFYSDEVNTQLLVSLLKEHNIKKIIASPGTTNICFVGSVQHDPFFEVYSAVDERSAAFMACGLSEESGEPVVLTCTGATASRNYIPGLTEAYYRHLPILAVTSSQHFGRIGNYVAQVVDRSSPFNDLVKKSYQLYSVYSKEDEQRAVTGINDIILELTHHSLGPVHVNLFTTLSKNFNVKKLPKCRVIKRVDKEGFPDLPSGKIGVFIGVHSPFSENETKAIDEFCRSNNAIVICEHCSNYRGEYGFLAALPNIQEKDLGTSEFDLIVYIGYVHGTYINFSSNNLWRVNPDGEIRDPYQNISYVFEMEEIDFFKHYISENDNNTTAKEYFEVITNLQRQIPKLPFSNVWIAKETSKYLPDKSILHLSILNTLRVWNYFEIPKTVQCYTNSGGFGIDGCLSSFMGSAIENPNIEHYLIIGDLSFFYDINSLLNKIPCNIHIMLINNGVGTEFKNYNHPCIFYGFGEESNKFMAAKGHNGFKNKDLVRVLSEELGLKYLSASTKEEYINNRDVWLSKGNGPILFEAFTSDKDESDALKLMNCIVKDDSIKSRLKRSIFGKFVKKVIKRR